MDETDIDLGPPVQVQSNDGRWRDEMHWPPRDAEGLRLHLGQTGTLDEDPGDEGVHVLYPGSAVYGTAVPWPLTDTASDGTEFAYTYGPLDHPLHIAGLPKAHLLVEAYGDCGYFGAFLYDEAPDGTRTRIGWTGMNLRYADGTEEPSEHAAFERFRAKAQIQPMDAVVPEGHSVVLVINTDAPSDRVPPAARLCPVDIRVGSGASVLELPVIERGPEAFFAPPMPDAA